MVSFPTPFRYTYMVTIKRHFTTSVTWTRCRRSLVEISLQWTARTGHEYYSIWRKRTEITCMEKTHSKGCLAWILTSKKPLTWLTRDHSALVREKTWGLGLAIEKRSYKFGRPLFISGKDAESRKQSCWFANFIEWWQLGNSTNCNILSEKERFPETSGFRTYKRNNKIWCCTKK